jgi:multidrug efflux pump subunit AcrA (membrane-fusion protein)
MVGEDQDIGGDTLNLGDAHRVAYLDHALWSQLEQTDDLEIYANAWLALQCQRIPEVSRGVLVLRSLHHDNMEPVAYWPKGRGATLGLSSAAEAALGEGRGVARARKRKSKPGQSSSVSDRCDVAQPIILDDEPVGVVALEVATRSKEALSDVIRQLQWGVAWISALYVRRASERDRAARGRLQTAVELFAAILERRRFAEAVIAFATELAVELDCDRVSIGLRRRHSSRVVALSHSAQFDRRMKLLRALEQAMDEAVDQWTALIHPPPDEQTAIVRAHRELAELSGAGAILTVPMLAGDRAVGAIVLERGGDNGFGPEDVEMVVALASLAGPTLEEKRLNDRFIVTKIVKSLWGQLGALFGPHNIGRKIVVTAFVLFAAFLVVAKGDYRITADTRLEGVVQRAIVAPFGGFIYEAKVRSGDAVRADDVLAVLDSRDLLIERLQWISDRERNRLEYDKAFASGDRPSLKILKARIAQADAQIALSDTLIERTTLRAPFDGIIVSGDLSQRIGGVVERGELLFEIAPLNDHRVLIKVDEREIADIKIGQTGHMVLSSLPERPLPLTIVRTTPVSEAAEGRNYFVVEARLGRVDDFARLRPGMEGVAKIHVDRQRLIWIWTHKNVDWFRLAFWRWWP